jgi:hypothetical protein
MIDIKKLRKKFDAFFNETDRRRFMSIVRKNRQTENKKARLLLLIALLFPVIGMGQTVGELRYDSTITFVHGPKIETIKKCDSGYSWMPSLSTSSLRIIADTCLPDSICKKLLLGFRENVCSETSMHYSTENYSYSSQNTWVNDSVGCVTKVTYSKRFKKKWIEISACQYYFENKGTNCSIFDGDESIAKPCCGHIHTIPDPDWK